MGEGEISSDDPRADDVRELLGRHLAFANRHSPPEDVHALDINGLLTPAITFFTCRVNGELLGIGALKRLDRRHAELKSMHTVETARGQGIGGAMLDHLIRVARDGGFRRLSLETGSMPAFAPARSLYEKRGFVPCGPFGDYGESPNSTFMTLVLDGHEREIERRADSVLEHHPRSARLIDLLRRVVREQSTEQVGLAASGAAFWLVITIFPTAIAAVSVFGLFVSPVRVARDVAGLANKGPQSLGAILAQQLQKVAAADPVGLTAGLAVSVVLALWTASAGVYNLERAIRTAYGLRPEEYFRARGRAIIGSIAVVLALGIVALLSTAASVVVDYLPVVVAVVVGVPLLVVVVAAITAALYRFSIGPAVVGRRLLPGSLAASICLVVVIGAFAVYLRLSTRYTAVYGALAGTVIGMIGTYLAVFVVLSGAVLNAQLDRTRATDQVNR